MAVLLRLQVRFDTVQAADTALFALISINNPICSGDRLEHDAGLSQPGQPLNLAASVQCAEAQTIKSRR